MLQRSAEWNRIRATAITASGCAAVLDRSPWTSRKDYLEQKAFEKVYGIGPRPSNVAMEEGIAWEPAVIEMSKPFVLGFSDLYYADNSGKVIDGVSTEYQQHPEIPFIGASPDKLIYRPHHGGRPILESGLEVKKQFRMSKRGPEAWFPCKEAVYHYWCQCQLSMEVFDVPHWDFFVVGQQLMSDETLPDGSPANVVPWSQNERIYRDRVWFEESLVEFVKFMDELEATIKQLKVEKSAGGIEPEPVTQEAAPIDLLDDPAIQNALDIDETSSTGIPPVALESDWDGVID